MNILNSRMSNTNESKLLIKTIFSYVYHIFYIEISQYVLNIVHTYHEKYVHVNKMFKHEKTSEHAF